MSAETSPVGVGFEPLDLGRQIVVFTGPEGAGKSTVAKDIASHAEKDLISTSVILHDKADHDETYIGKACKKMFQDHTYLDPKIVLEILVDLLKQKNTENGFIGEGFLRSVAEVQGFQSAMEAAGRVMPMTVVNLRIPGWMSFERLVTGPNARKRSDDTLEGLLPRLSNYYNGLGERSSYIRHHPGWQLLQVDATGNREENVEAVLTVLRAHATVE